MTRNLSYRRRFEKNLVKVVLISQFNNFESLCFLKLREDCPEKISQARLCVAFCNSAESQERTFLLSAMSKESAKNTIVAWSNVRLKIALGVMDMIRQDQDIRNMQTQK